MLSTSVRRSWLLLGHTVIAVVLAIVLLLCTPLGMYAVAASMMDNPPGLLMLIKASLNYLPALLAFVGLSALLTGAAPRLTSLVWLLLVYALIIAYLGNMMLGSAADTGVKDAFDVALKLSPFSLLPIWPQNDFNFLLSFAMALGAMVLMALGALVFNRRDIRG